MANIPLRAYLREIEGLIDSGQLEETVAHCRYILQTYPKYIDTYRLLGKVFLEAKQFSNAADILQRVLSAVPDDFVSHVGMSIIREDEGNLDGAIWHMERAFESQPSNKAIQDELRRLFGRRDGMEPPKIRLTRGALARMYAKGNLYDQATAELRGALSEDPQRPDLLLLLAQMNYMAENRVEAVETSRNIMKKFPYCLIANRILALILPQTERADDAKIYRQRAYALDPYLTKAGTDILTSEDVPDSSILIETLERQPGQPIEGLQEQPAWAATLGIKFDGTADEELPDWLSEDMSIPSYEGEQTAPFVEEKATEQPGTEFEETEEKLPEWMQEAGWQPSTGEIEGAPTGEETGEASEEGEIEKAEIPDWLKEIASVEAMEEATTVEAISEDALPPWLDETPPGPTDSIISWLGEKETSEESGAETEFEPQEEGEIPEWLQDIEGEKEIESETPLEVSAPTLEGLEESEELVAEKEEELPEWLKELTEPEGVITAESQESVEEITAEPVEEGLEWLEELEGEQLEGFAGSDERLMEVETGSTPEHDLDEVVEEKLETSEILIESESAAEEIDIPDWLKNLDEESEGEPIFDEGLQEKTEIPDWLQELGETAEVEELPIESKLESELGVIPEAEETHLEELQTEQELAPEKTGELDDEMQDAALAWLESLAAKQGASEDELITKPEERLESPPEWITQEEISTELEAETELPEGELASEAELPEWLQDVEETQEAQNIEPGEAISEMPAWVRDLDKEEHEGEEPAGEEMATVSSEISDEDAGLAWLESLAAKQGASEEELITHPEDRLIEPPAWVQEEAEIGTEVPSGEAEPDLQVDVPVSEEIETWIPEIQDQALPVEEGAEILPEVTYEEVKVDLNTGSLSELESIPGVGFVLAQSIIEYRDQYGLFDSIEEVKNVPGIDDLSFEYIKDQLTVEVSEKAAPIEEVELVSEGIESEELVEAKSAVTVGEIDQAIEAYDQLIKQSENLDEVISVLLADISQHPDNILLWQALGDAYMRNDQFQKALEAYTKAEKLL